MERATLLGRLTWQIAEVRERRVETPRTVSLVFSVPAWSGHKAGQHVDIRLTAEDGYQAQRSYSIASPPEELEQVTLTVERLANGEVSPYLVDELRIGDRIELRGPIGGYFVWETRLGGPLLLIAGGSGIVPLMAMLRHRRVTGSKIPTRLLVSARSIEDVIYRSELEHLVENSDVDVIYTLTRTILPGWTGYHRRIDSHLLSEVAWPEEQHPLAYICGPTQFVETVASNLLALGYFPERVKTERFGPTGDT